MDGAPLQRLGGAAGQSRYVVGDGNSAGQAATYLAAHADRVTILARGESLHESMSEHVIRQIEATDNISVRTHAASWQLSHVTGAA